MDRRRASRRRRPAERDQLLHRSPVRHLGRAGPERPGRTACPTCCRAGSACPIATTTSRRHSGWTEYGRPTAPTSPTCSSWRRSPTPTRRRHGSSISSARSPRCTRRAPSRPTSRRATITGRATSSARKRPASTGPRCSHGAASRAAPRRSSSGSPAPSPASPTLVSERAARVVARLSHVPRDRSPRRRAAEGVRRRSVRVLRQGAERDAEAARSVEARGRRDQRRARRGGRQDVRAAPLSGGVEGAAPGRWSRTSVAAFDRRIDALTWMAPKTKDSAKAKLADAQGRHRLSGHAGATTRKLRGRARRRVRQRRARRARSTTSSSGRKLGRPPDRSEWWMTPQTVNAVNLPVQNALNFPAAILEPPFLRSRGQRGAATTARSARSSATRSATASTTGQPVRRRGPLRQLVDAGGSRALQGGVGRQLVAQYNAYMPFPDLHVNGQLTLSENIADVAGLSAAYDAYRAARGGMTDASGRRRSQRSSSASRRAGGPRCARRSRASSCSPTATRPTSIAPTRCATSMRGTPRSRSESRAAAVSGATRSRARLVTHRTLSASSICCSICRMTIS